MGNEKRSYLLKKLHGLQERTSFPSVETSADGAVHDGATTTTTTATTTEAGPSPSEEAVSPAPAASTDGVFQEKRIVLSDDNDNDEGEGATSATDDPDLAEETSDDEATELEDAFAFARQGLRRKSYNHNHKYAVESLAVMAKVPLKRQALQDKETMLGRMPGFPVYHLQHDIERFFKFYSNLVASEGRGKRVRVLPMEMDKRVMLYGALAQTLRGAAVDIEEARLLMTLGAKSFVVALYALMNELQYRTLPDIFKMSPGVGVDASDVFDQHLSEAFQKGCRLLNLQPNEVQLIENDCISKNELIYLTSAKR